MDALGTDQIRVRRREVEEKVKEYTSDHHVNSINNPGFAGKISKITKKSIKWR